MEFHCDYFGVRRNGKGQIAPVLLVRPGQESNRLLELISEIDRLLREKEMRLRNVRREASKYVIEAAEKKAS